MTSDMNNPKQCAWLMQKFVDCGMRQDTRNGQKLEQDENFDLSLRHKEAQTLTLLATRTPQQNLRLSQDWAIMCKTRLAPNGSEKSRWFMVLFRVSHTMTSVFTWSGKWATLCWDALITAAYWLVIWSAPKNRDGHPKFRWHWEGWGNRMKVVFICSKFPTYLGWAISFPNDLHYEFNPE